MCSCAVNQLQTRETRGLLIRVGPGLHNDGARHRGNIRTRTPALPYRPRRGGGAPDDDAAAADTAVRWQWQGPAVSTRSETDWGC